MTTVRSVLLEALCVAVAVAALALAANALSPRGLRLGRDYFPRVQPVAATGVQPETRSGVKEPDPAREAAAADRVLERLAQQGLGIATAEEMTAWFADPGYAAGLTVFVDARDEAQYAAGHIPGAWQFHHYRAETQLPLVLPACLNALRVAVYCRGGDCEDSAFAALMLRDAGVPAGNIYVYPGGITEWKAREMPVERGARGSGELAPQP